RAIIRRKHEIAAGYGLDAPYYHLTRDELAALGGGDAEAGANVVDQTFAGVPIKDGRERIIPGRILTEIGEGNLNHGAEVIDRLIERMRDAHGNIQLPKAEENNN